jgi:hypothetical protein
MLITLDAEYGIYPAPQHSGHRVKSNFRAPSCRSSLCAPRSEIAVKSGFFAQLPVAGPRAARRANFAAPFAKTAERRKRYMASGFFVLIGDAKPRVMHRHASCDRRRAAQLRGVLGS